MVKYQYYRISNIGRIIKFNSLLIVNLIIFKTPFVYLIFDNLIVTNNHFYVNSYLDWDRMFANTTPLTLACINPLVIPAPSPPAYSPLILV